LAADDQLGEGFCDLAVGFQVGLDVPLHGERDVGVTDALAERLPVDLGVRSGIAVPDAVQVVPAHGGLYRFIWGQGCFYLYDEAVRQMMKTKLSGNYPAELVRLKIEDFGLGI